jgi:hypothetical protein
MSPTATVTYTTPDGVKRAVRLTFGARKRIADKFGMPLAEVMKRYDTAALPDILYCCMCDDAAGGKPPKDLPPNWADGLEIDADMETEMSVSFMEMLAKGGIEKNALRAMIQDGMASQMKARYGLSFGPSPDSASESLPVSSGAAPTESSTHSPGDSASASDSSTTAPAS